MAEIFFGAAWAAGVAEGGSVLLQASKQDDKTRGGAMLLVPSILYGTAALPLGIIGASPGPSLVSSFPFAPSIQSLENNGVNEAPPAVSNNKNTNDTTDESKPTPTTNKQESDTVPSDGEHEHEEHVILSRSDFIRKVREDNRRSLAAKQQHRPSFRSSPKLIKVKPTHPKSTTTTTKLISTLDGRPLATPLAEAMRRARFLCVGAGLVLTIMSYQTSQQQQAEREKALQREQQLRGRDAGAIQSLVQQSDNDNGAVVRLVGQNDSLPGLMTNEKSNGVVLPLVHPVDSSVNAPDNLPSINNNGRAYWNLGTTPQEWKEMPLTTDWLLRSNENACLVLEADVSPNSLSDYLQDVIPHVRLEPASIQLIENALMVSRILCMIAKEKKVLPADDETAVNVLIGAGPRPTWLGNASTVYIDGSKTVGIEVSSILERLHSDAETPSTQQESDATKDMTASESESASIPSNDASEDSTVDAFSLFEYVGMKLREGGTYAATAVSRVFARRDIKTVHVLSDSPVAAQWLQSTMPYGWIILGYNALDDIGPYHDDLAESGNGVTFVCCENDEATSAMVCSLLLSTNDKADASGQRLVVLVQEEACATELRNLGIELSDETIVEIVSVREVHNNLFGHARELLASGKSVAEVQDSIDLID